MGGACSVGGRITSDELDHHPPHDHPPSQSPSPSPSPQITPTNDNNNKTKMKKKKSNKNKKHASNSMLITSINDKFKRIKSFGSNLNKQHKNKDNDDDDDQFPRASPQRFFSGELRFSSSSDKVTPRGSSFIGRASEKAVDVLDALGSGITNLNSTGFLTPNFPNSNKISILAFEVANTISRGDKLLHSLSNQNTTFIKEHLIPSPPVHHLVSSDTNLLLSLVAADKREELDVFCKEVTRFGNHCKDPQWHNLDRYFHRLDSDNAAYRHEREQAETKMIELLSLAEHTSELYHELNAFDRYEQDYRQKVEEMRALNLPRKGEHLMMLSSELRQQKKIVMSLKKKSLWSRKLEEVIEKLVDIVAFIRQEITEVFGTGQITSAEKAGLSTQRLGPAGLALHYANVINQMDNISSRPTSLPPNIRDTLYRGLPATVKDALRSKLRKLDAEEELDVPQIKAEMERILEWLSPVAMNTLKAHQGFGWVGEWANASTEFSKKTVGNGSIIRLQTFYHASKEKTDTYILTLVTLLHRLINGIKRVDHRDRGLRNLPLQSPSKKAFLLNSPLKIYPSLYNGNKTFRVELSEEDRRLLQKMSKSRLGSGISKSQELQKTCSKVRKSWGWSRSMESSPYRERRRGHLPDNNELELVSRWIEAPF